MSDLSYVVSNVVLKFAIQPHLSRLGKAVHEVCMDYQMRQVKRETGEGAKKPTSTRLLAPVSRFETRPANHEPISGFPYVPNRVHCTPASLRPLTGSRLLSGQSLVPWLISLRSVRICFTPQHILGCQHCRSSFAVQG